MWEAALFFPRNLHGASITTSGPSQRNLSTVLGLIGSVACCSTISPCDGGFFLAFSLPLRYAVQGNEIHLFGGTLRLDGVRVVGCSAVSDKTSDAVCAGAGKEGYLHICRLGVFECVLPRFS